MTTVTKEITVGGSCEMCEMRIEKAAKNIGGVSKAKWDRATKLLTVTYDTSKVTLDSIEKKIAAVGHDTPHFKADDNVYSALPACCHYRKPEGL